MRIQLDKSLQGRILDVGGGGEGVIGRVYGRQVIAIDNCQEELDEMPDVCEKVLMDATSMSFQEGEFDHVTAFYAMMYMTREEQRKAIREAARVLKPGGEMHIWDAVIRCAHPDPFVVELDIDAYGTAIHTTYGVVKMDSQDAELLIGMGQEAGLTLTKRAMDGDQFCLRFRKDAH